MHKVGTELVLRNDDVDDAFGIFRRPAQPMQVVRGGRGGGAGCAHQGRGRVLCSPCR